MTIWLQSKHAHHLLVAAVALSSTGALCQAAPNPTYQPATAYDQPDRPTFVITADFDGDGDRDVALTRRDANVAEILLNDGSGALMPQQTVGVEVAPRGLIAADLDGDGDTDIAVANWSTESSSVSILLNDGAATFTNVANVELSEAARPRTMAALDVDLDGDLDLATANNFGNSVGMLLNDGAANFTHITDIPSGNQPGSVHAGDLNGDGWPDLVATSRADDTVTVYLNNGAGTLVFSEDHYAGNVPRDEALGDFDNDGDLDLLVAAGGAGFVIAYRNDGSGHFTNIGAYASGENPHSVKLRDLNFDGAPDMIVGDAGGLFAIIRMNTGNAFGGEIPIAIGATQVFIEVADLNGDGVQDLLHVDGVLKLRVQIGNPFTGECIPGDVNLDGLVNALDLASILAAWGAVDGTADVNKDGAVNGTDLAIVLSNWAP